MIAAESLVKHQSIYDSDITKTIPQADSANFVIDEVLQPEDQTIQVMTEEVIKSDPNHDQVSMNILIGDHYEDPISLHEETLSVYKSRYSNESIRQMKQPPQISVEGDGDSE